MTTLNKSLLLTMLALAVFSCCKDDPSVGYLKMIDDIPANKYYDHDVLADKGFEQLNGVWKVSSTSGGFTGAGYTPDFDYLLIKPNAVFGIVRNDSLITTGQIKVIDDPAFDLFVHFISEVPAEQTGVNIIDDYEKFIVIQGDSLSLYSTCCDRFDTHLRKIE